MAEVSRYSLWLVPEGAAAGALQRAIDELARQHGGPTFPPHLTLFGSLAGEEDDVVERCRRLASRLTRLTVHLDGIDVGETYFQSLFATVRPTPELLAARDAAQQLFPEVPPVPYRPHVSLVYGHPSAETKRAILQTLRGTLPPSFGARTLVVYETGAGLDDWRLALRAPFGG
ncbi:MAG: 2'-5' RNA ligase family protein [Chloroflexota bacterium]